MNINKHPLYKAIYDLCLEIETMSPSPLHTKLAVMASDLEKPADLLFAQWQNALDRLGESIGLEFRRDSGMVEASKKSNGQIAYEAYCNHTNWKSLVSGNDLPQWGAVNPDIQKAWSRSAQSVISNWSATLTENLDEMDRRLRDVERATEAK